jgi:hypothetical protein
MKCGFLRSMGRELSPRALMKDGVSARRRCSPRSSDCPDVCNESKHLAFDDYCAMMQAQFLEVRADVSGALRVADDIRITDRAPVARLAAPGEGHSGLRAHGRACRCGMGRLIRRSDRRTPTPSSHNGQMCMGSLLRQLSANEPEAGCMRCGLAMTRRSWNAMSSQG